MLDSRQVNSNYKVYNAINGLKKKSAIDNRDTQPNKKIFNMLELYEQNQKYIYGKYRTF